MNDFGVGWLGAQRIELAACNSTNDEAARLARAGARHGTVVTALAQTAGRGREGRAWASPPGLGLYVSAIVRPPLPLAMVPPMTLAIGVAVCETARELGVPATLKWPNDTLVNGKKLAGVLVEAHSQGTRLESVVVGIGLNVCGELPSEVAAIATTLAREGARDVARDHVLGVLLCHVERWIDRFVASGVASIIPAWQARMARGLAARATVHVGGALRAVVGEVVGLDVDGALVLRDETGVTHRVRSGDVEVVTNARPTEPESPRAAC